MRINTNSMNGEQEKRLHEPERLSAEKVALVKKSGEVRIHCTDSRRVQRRIDQMTRTLLNG